MIFLRKFQRALMITLPSLRRLALITTEKPARPTRGEVTNELVCRGQR